MLISARAAFARPGPRAMTFPDFIAHLCSPPTPSFPSVVTMVVPRQRPTLAWTLLLCGAICMASADQTRVHVRLVRRRLVTGSPSFRVSPRRNEGLPGAWLVLLLRAVVIDPAGCVLALPIVAASPPSSSGPPSPSTPGISTLSWLFSHGPFARVPTHRRIHCCFRRKARFRLGGLHPSPGGILTRWTINRIS